MEKPENTDPDSREAENPPELKKELKKQIKLILVEDDYGVEIDKAISILSSLKEREVRGIESADESIMILSLLKELKFKESVYSPVVVPEEFKCPLSREIMSDPVVLASGKTYDRCHIQKWFHKGHNSCPETQQDLMNPILTPNHLVREMITEWCNDRGIEIPKSVQDINEAVTITFPDRDCLGSLLDSMSSLALISEKKESAKTLQQLTRKFPSFLVLFGESTDNISKLLTPLLSSRAHMHHPDLQEDIITTVFYISVPDDNKKVVAENSVAIPLLMDALRNGTIQTKRNAAAALYTLSALNSNKNLIGNYGAIKPLIDLVQEGHPETMKDVSLALYQLCREKTNKGRAIHKGVVRVILEKIIGGAFVDLLLPVLTRFSRDCTAAYQMGEIVGAVPCLLGIIRDSANKDSNSTAYCATILYDICLHDSIKLIEIKEEENVNGTISNVARSRTRRARGKATEILDMLQKMQ